MALVVMLAAPFLLKSMLASASLRTASAGRSAAGAALLLASASIAVAMVLGVAARTARSLSVPGHPGPLALYPGGRRGLAASHLWGEVARTGLWLLFFFYLFYGALIGRLADRPLLTVPAHLLAHVLVLAVGGVFAYRSTLRMIEAHPGVGRAIYLGASAGAVVAFLALAASPTILGDLTPGVVVWLGAHFDPVAAVYPPLTVFVQPGESLLVPAGWLAGIAVSAVLASAMALPLMREPSPAFLGDAEPSEERRFINSFRERRSRTLPGGTDVHLFFLKDVWLPAARHPLRLFTRQWALLALALTPPVVLWQLRREGRVSDLASEAALWGTLMALPSLAAYLNGLMALGSEGRAFALIRPFLRPATLWRSKVLSVLAAVVPSGFTYGLIVGAAGAGLGLEPGPLRAAGVGGLAAVVASVNAVALGFLFPDFRRRGVLAPGASPPARRLFELLALYGIGLSVVTLVLTRTAAIPPGMLAPILITTATLGLTLGWVITLVALHRLPRLEI